MKPQWRPLAPGEHDTEKTALFSLPLIAAAGAAWLIFRLPLPSCTFKAISGYPCAGCGATRATHALANGEPLSALLLNPMTILGYACIAAFFFYSAYAVLTRGKTRLRFPPKSQRQKIMIRLGLVALFAANWAWVLLTLPESPCRLR